MTGAKAECETDMEVTDRQGFMSCTVTDDSMTCLDTVELLEHKDHMVGHPIMFPGIEKDDVDF